MCWHKIIQKNECKKRKKIWSKENKNPITLIFVNISQLEHIHILPLKLVTGRQFDKNLGIATYKYNKKKKNKSKIIIIY